MFIYNKTSFWAKEWVRWIDYFLIILLLITFFGEPYNTRFNYFFISVICGAFAAWLITEKAVESTEFFVNKGGDKEINKKVVFTEKYSLVAFVLCSSVFHYLWLFLDIVSDEATSIPAYIILFPVAFLVLNVLNIGNLFFPFFEDELTL